MQEIGRAGRDGGYLRRWSSSPAARTWRDARELRLRRHADRGRDRRARLPSCSGRRVACVLRRRPQPRCRASTTSARSWRRRCSRTSSWQERCARHALLRRLRGQGFAPCPSPPSSSASTASRALRRGHLRPGDARPHLVRGSIRTRSRPRCRRSCSGVVHALEYLEEQSLVELRASGRAPALWPARRPGPRGGAHEGSDGSGF